MARTVLVLLGLFSLSLANHIDLNSYTFSASLSSEIGQGDDYQLYWNINRTGDPTTSIISFAVRVRTTGWVGLGVSPTGDMTGSDVVIGWVNEGDLFLHDRFADARTRPPVDESQDWFITDGAEMDGYTVLLFWRYWVTCDDRDNPIEANTARVVFSWNNADPADDNPDNVVYHSQMRGAISLNLLGGQSVTPTLPDDAKTFTLRVDNITIPNVDTTYFCQPFELDEDLIATERYIVKFAPVISETSLQYVHHVLLYICNGLTSNDPLVGDACGVIDDNVAQCRDGVLLGAWAVGGTDFLYPKDIAYPFGGPGHSRYVLMEMHYNNPNLDEGVIDSSGFEFTYTDVEPTHKAGILTTGLRVTPLQIIPPGVESFKTTGTCFSPCTERFLPEEGITIFANTLHTHLLGTGLVVHHLRKRSLDECEVDEELPPIETNLQYDFNFQQLNYLPEEIHVKPGDELVLECRYKSTERGSVTYGGLSTYDEMCLTFLVYYPRAPLDICLSFPDLTEWAEGLSQLTEEQRQAISGASSNNLNPSTYYPAVEAIDWTIDNEVESLEYQATYGRQFAYCEDGIAEDRIRFTNQIQVDCPYVAPDICSDSPTDSPECVCPETEPTTEPTAGAGTITISTLLMMLCLVAFL